MNKTRTQRREPESILQASIFDAIKEILLPEVLITCFPSGGGGRVRGAKLKKMGLSSGWPDLQLVYKAKFYGLEVKTPIGRLSPAQSELHTKLIQQGVKVAVVRSEKDAIQQIIKWRLHKR
tara:strand:+ start:570 stop:932 length:363 start_codon:yes stop_codon:yes gene_type:complete